MQPLVVVEAQVFPDPRRRLNLVGKVPMMYQFRLQGVEEGLRHGIGEWRPLAAPAPDHACRLDQFPHVMRGILDTLVGVEDTIRHDRLS